MGHGPTPSPESRFPNPGTGSERARSDNDAVGTGQADVHEIVELRLPVFELSKLSNVPLDALRGDVGEFEKTRVQWSKTRTPYSPLPQPC